MAPTGETPDLFRPGTEISCGRAMSRRRVDGVRPHRDRWLVSFAGVTDRDAAEALRGEEMFVDSSCLPPPPAGEYLVGDLIGCRVSTKDGELLGTVHDIRAGGAHDFLELEAVATTMLIPMVKSWLCAVDLKRHHIVLDLPSGLIEATAAPDEAKSTGVGAADRSSSEPGEGGEPRP